jgi:hypothetical protein
MKLVNLVPLKEIDFRNQDAFDDYNKQHKLRPTTKVTIAGKVTTAGQAAQKSEPVKGASVFGKDGGGSVFSKEKSKYDDKSYWKDDERERQGQGADDDYGYDDEEAGDGVALTSDRLNKVESALEDDLKLRDNGFETTRESSGGGGGWEGPMTIVSKDADYNDEDNYISLSVGSPNNDGKFSIVFANSNGEPYFEPDYDALTGDNDLEPQQAYKVTKALMKMPEVQKVLKGEMSIDEFQPIYDNLKAKFSKSSGLKESAIRLKSLIKRNK